MSSESNNDIVIAERAPTAKDIQTLGIRTLVGTDSIQVTATQATRFGAYDLDRIVTSDNFVAQYRALSAIEMVSNYRLSEAFHVRGELFQRTIIHLRDILSAYDNEATDDAISELNRMAMVSGRSKDYDKLYGQTCDNLAAASFAPTWHSILRDLGTWTSLLYDGPNVDALRICVPQQLYLSIGTRLGDVSSLIDRYHNVQRRLGKRYRNDIHNSSAIASHQQALAQVESQLDTLHQQATCLTMVMHALHIAAAKWHRDATADDTYALSVDIASEVWNLYNPTMPPLPSEPSWTSGAITRLLVARASFLRAA